MNGGQRPHYCRSQTITKDQENDLSKTSSEASFSQCTRAVPRISPAQHQPLFHSSVAQAHTWKAIVYRDSKAIGALCHPRIVFSQAASSAELVLVTLHYNFIEFPAGELGKTSSKREQPLQLPVDDLFRATAQFRVDLFCSFYQRSVFSIPNSCTFAGAEVAAAVSQHIQRLQYICSQQQRFRSGLNQHGGTDSGTSHSLGLADLQEHYTVERGDFLRCALKFDIEKSPAVLCEISLQLAVLSDHLDETDFVAAAETSTLAHLAEANMTSHTVAAHLEVYELKADKKGKKKTGDDGTAADMGQRVPSSGAHSRPTSTDNDEGSLTASTLHHTKDSMITCNADDALTCSTARGQGADCSGTSNRTEPSMQHQHLAPEGSSDAHEGQAQPRGSSCGSEQHDPGQPADNYNAYSSAEAGSGKRGQKPDALMPGDMACNCYGHSTASSHRKAADIVANGHASGGQCSSSSDGENDVPEGRSEMNGKQAHQAGQNGKGLNGSAPFSNQPTQAVLAVRNAPEAADREQPDSLNLAAADQAAAAQTAGPTGSAPGAPDTLQQQLQPDLRAAGKHDPGESNSMLAGPAHVSTAATEASGSSAVAGSVAAEAATCQPQLDVQAGSTTTGSASQASPPPSISAGDSDWETSSAAGDSSSSYSETYSSGSGYAPRHRGGGAGSWGSTGQGGSMGHMGYTGGRRGNRGGYNGSTGGKPYVPRGGHSGGGRGYSSRSGEEYMRPPSRGPHPMMMGPGRDVGVQASMEGVSIPSTQEPAASTDLERFLVQVTPMLALDPSKPLDMALQELRLEDVWRFYHEPSLYGREVYTLGGARGPSLCYFVPYLSAMQLFTPASPKDPGTSRLYISDTEGWPKHMHLKFEHFENELPFNRCPMYEQIETLSAQAAAAAAASAEAAPGVHVQVGSAGCNGPVGSSAMGMGYNRSCSAPPSTIDGGGSGRASAASSRAVSQAPSRRQSDAGGDASDGGAAPAGSADAGASSSEAAAGGQQGGSSGGASSASGAAGASSAPFNVLRDTRVCDLHPASWFAVAWYPVYRIPDAPLCARFLTFHSFAPLVISMQHAQSALERGQHRPVAIMPLQVVGLKWYNMQGERWLEALTESPSGGVSGVMRGGLDDASGGGSRTRRTYVQAAQMDIAWQAHLSELQGTAERLARGHGLRLLGQMGAEELRLRVPDFEFFNARG